MRRSRDVHQDLGALRAPSPPPSSLLHQWPPLLPSPLATGAGCAGLACPPLPPTCCISQGTRPGARFPKFFHLSAPKQLLRTFSFFVPPSHSPAPSPGARHPTRPGPSATALPGAHTASGYRSLSPPPARSPLGTLTPAVPTQRSRQTRNGHQPGPCLLRGVRTRVLERAAGSGRAAGASPSGREDIGAGEKAAGLQKPQEGSVWGGRADPPALPWQCCRAAG